MRYSQNELRVHFYSALLLAVFAALICSNSAVAVVVNSADKTILAEWMKYVLLSSPSIQIRTGKLGFSAGTRPDLRRFFLFSSAPPGATNAVFLAYLAPGSIQIVSL